MLSGQIQIGRCDDWLTSKREKEREIERKKQRKKKEIIKKAERKNQPPLNQGHKSTKEVQWIISLISLSIICVWSALIIILNISQVYNLASSGFYKDCCLWFCLLTITSITSILRTNFELQNNLHDLEINILK